MCLWKQKPCSPYFHVWLLLQFSFIHTGFEDVFVLSDSDVVNIPNIGYDVAVVQSGNKNSSKCLVCYVLCSSDISF